MSHETHWDPAVRELIARAEARGAERALDRLLARADEGIEFGPDNYTRLVRMVREVRTSPDCACPHKLIAGCDHDEAPVEMRHCDGCGEDYNAFEESHVGHEATR